MEPLNSASYPGDGLLEIYQRFMAMAEEHGPEKVGMPMMCAIAVLKVAMMALVEASQPSAARAFERGQEKLHAGDALVQVGAACTAAAMVLHAKLIAIQPNTLSVQRAGEMTVKLNKLASQMTQAGYRMTEAAEREGQAGNA